MAKEKNLTELINSYQFQCRGTTNIGGTAKIIGFPALSIENALPVIVKIYRDGKSEAECTCLVEDSCRASYNSNKYGKCPYVTEARKLK